MLTNIISTCIHTVQGQLELEFVPSMSLYPAFFNIYYCGVLKFGTQVTLVFVNVPDLMGSPSLVQMIPAKIRFFHSFSSHCSVHANAVCHYYYCSCWHCHDFPSKLVTEHVPRTLQCAHHESDGALLATFLVICSALNYF